MIYAALKLLRDELGRYLELKNEGINSINADSVVLDNVARVDGNNPPELQDRVIITLVNLEEESVFKNTIAQHRTLRGGVEYENPPVHLNLYLLFCANFLEGELNYEHALQQLSFVVQFFQGNNVFTLQNSPNAANLGPDEDDPDLAELRLILDLYTLTFEQINHLWGSLGGKQIPFAMYKVRLIKVRDRRVQKAGEEIREIHSTEDIY